MEPGNEDMILEHLRSVDWECETTAQYGIMCLTNAAGINYQKIPVLASLVAGLVEYQVRIFIYKKLDRFLFYYAFELVVYISFGSDKNCMQ